MVLFLDLPDRLPHHEMASEMTSRTSQNYFRAVAAVALT